jgi:hypothetical protein
VVMVTGTEVIHCVHGDVVAVCAAAGVEIPEKATSERTTTRLRIHFPQIPFKENPRRDAGG